MKKVGEKFSALDLVKKPALLRQLVREIEQVKNRQYVLGSGEVRRAQHQPRALDSTVYLGGQPTTISAFAPQCNVAGSGGDETFDVGTKRVHVFKTSGMFTAGCTGTVDVLIIAGGGGGGQLGGGGAGGRRRLQVPLQTSGAYPIVVGAGGAGSTAASAAARGTNGESSSAFNITSTGGGGGGGYGDGVQDGLAGGSGGGGGEQSSFLGGSGGSPVDGQGSSGGNGQNGVMGSQAGGGGGGAGGAGGTGGLGGQGGAGVADDITGPAIVRAAGGGAGGTAAAGVGGSGNIGGHGATPTTPASSPVANTGSGGGGGVLTSQPATAGAAGVVIISYERTGTTVTIPPSDYEAPDPEPPAEADCEECTNKILVSRCSGEVITSRTGYVLTSRNDPP